MAENSYFIWNLSPEIVRLGPFSIRYYSLLFVGVFLLGFVLWQWQMRRYGAEDEKIDKFLIWSIIAVVVGARLGHCIFYNPEYYLTAPWKIFMTWKGGLSSHGATAGLVAALWFFAYRFKYPFGEVMDRFTMSACVGATLVRIGNFLNSEIVGSVTDVPWAVRFMRYTDQGAYPRHPSQIYEVFLGIFVFLVLYFTDRSLGEKRPRWLMTGLFFSLYFSGRFFVEFFKEYQTLDPTFPLTMGQILSILPALFGIALTVWSVRKKSA